MTDKTFDETTEATERSAKRPSTEGADAYAYNWYVWNISMGADNVLANAVQSIESKGVTDVSGSGRTREGEGADGQRVRVFSALTGDGPKSIFVLTVADTVVSQVNDLGHEIRDDMRDRLGIG